MYEKLFTPGKIGNVTVKNRLVMSPMGIGLAELDGSPSEDMLAFYEARAMGGAGLIIPEITRVNDVHGAGLMRQLSVTQDRHIPGLARLATAVHTSYTPLSVISLFHGLNEHDLQTAYTELLDNLELQVEGAKNNPHLLQKFLWISQHIIMFGEKYDVLAKRIQIIKKQIIEYLTGGVSLERIPQRY